jgi:hypothetical protein
VHAIRMDTTIFVIAAAVMAAPTLTLVDVPILTPVDAPTVTAVMKKSHVIMVAATTIPLVKMMTN